ncbi:MAG: hypothetical protein C4530_09220 [Desulfobacteraceae bacterium]|nr:MAG: hypothetical protein C4530_09220 [Desulfobacteraceae bacterium]
MSDPSFRTAEDYELFVYTLKDRFPSIQRSTLVFIRRGASLARIAGELHFNQDVRLVVRERLIYDRLPIVVDWYGYEIWRGEEKLYWYDSQPHPDEANVKATHPHHKHVPPDIKHNRIPAPEMSFCRPNLNVLIQEIEKLIQEIEGKRSLSE